MEQQVAALIQQVTEMNERMRQSEEASEQARQLLEAHRLVGQMLEERMRPNGSECDRYVSSWWEQARQGRGARSTRS